MTKKYLLYAVFAALFFSACTVLPPEVPPPKRIDPADHGKVLIKSFRYMEAYDYLLETATTHPDNAKARAYLVEVCGLLNRDVPTLPALPPSPRPIAPAAATPKPEPANIDSPKQAVTPKPKTTLVSHLKSKPQPVEKKSIKPTKKPVPAPKVHWVNPDTPLSRRRSPDFTGPQTNFVTSATDTPELIEQPTQPKTVPSKIEHSQRAKSTKKKKTYLKSFKSSSSNNNTLMKFFGF